MLLNKNDHKRQKRKKKQENMLETNLYFKVVFPWLCLPLLYNRKSDSRDHFCFKVKPFCCMRRCMSLSEHLTRSRTVNVFSYYSWTHFFFLIKNGQLDGVVLSFFLHSLPQHFIMMGHTVRLNQSDCSPHMLYTESCHFYWHDM